MCKPDSSLIDYFPDRFLTGPDSNRTGNYRTTQISCLSGLLTLTGVLLKCRYHPNWASTEITGKFISMWSCWVLPDSGTVPTGLPLGIIRLSRTALLLQRIRQNTPLLHVSGLSPERDYMTDNMIIHFLHMEPSNPPTYYTDLYIYKHLPFTLMKQINTIYSLMIYTSVLLKNTT